MTVLWSAHKLGDVMDQVRDPVALEDEYEYKQVTVSLHGRGVRLRQTIRGKDVKTKNQYRVREGQFIYSRIDARNGAMGLVPPELEGAVVTSDFPVFSLRENVIVPEFLSYLIRTKRFVEACLKPSRGVTNRKRLKEDIFLDIEVSLPPVEEQRRIASLVGRAASRSQEANGLRAMIEDKQSELLFGIVREMSQEVEMDTMTRVAPVVRRKVELEPDAEYPELGIRSFGNGTFHKPAIKGADLGSKRIYQIEPGDLLFSNVFSWEGAIAVAQPRDKGRYGSHRFITCVPDPERATANFLRYYFLSPEGLAKIRAASPGAAGRNKTLGIKKLEAIEVPLPPIEKQRHFDRITEKVWRAKGIGNQVSDELEAMLPALLDRAFKGEL